MSTFDLACVMKIPHGAAVKHSLKIVMAIALGVTLIAGFVEHSSIHQSALYELVSAVLIGFAAMFGFWFVAVLVSVLLERTKAAETLGRIRLRKPWETIAKAQSEGEKPVFRPAVISRDRRSVGRSAI